MPNNFIAIIYADLEAMYADAAGSARVRNDLQQEGLISNACVLPLTDVGTSDCRRDIDLCACCLWMGSGRPEALGQIQRPVYYSVDEVRQFLQAKGTPAKSATHPPTKVKKEKKETKVKSTSKPKEPTINQKVKEILQVLPYIKNAERIERFEAQIENLLFPSLYGLKWNSISVEELTAQLNKEQEDVSPV